MATAWRWAVLVRVCERKWILAVSALLPRTRGPPDPVAPRTLSPPGTQGPGRPAPPVPAWPPTGPVGWGHHPWCSPRSPLSHVGFMFACLFAFIVIQIYFIWFGNFQPQKSKKIERLGCPCPDPLRLWGSVSQTPGWAPPPLWKGSQGEQEGNWGQVGTGLPTCVWSPRGARASGCVGGHWAQAWSSRRCLQAQRFWNASGQGVLMGVRGKGFVGLRLESSL